MLLIYIAKMQYYSNSNSYHNSNYNTWCGFESLTYKHIYALQLVTSLSDTVLSCNDK